MPKKRMYTYQYYTIWSYGKAIRKKKTPGDLLWQLCTSGRWLAPSTKIIWRSRQRHHHPWVPHHQWLGQQSTSPPNKRENALKSVPSKATRKKQQKGIRVSAVLEPEVGKRPEICLSGAGSVGEPAMAVWLLAIRLLKNYTASYSD